MFTARYFHEHSHVTLRIRKDDPGVPTVYQQAESLGGSFVRITKGMPKGSVANFSPCIIKHRNKTLITWRSQPEPFCFRYDNQYFYMNGQPTDVYLGELLDDSTVIGTKKIRSKPHKLSYEDPRLFIGPDDELYVQFVGSTYASQKNKGGKKLFDQPKVIVAYINETGEAVSPTIPPIGKNREKGVPEKNWCFFTHQDELCCLYSTRPLVIERETNPTITTNTDVLENATKGAATFNSTAPIELENGFLVFYHWKKMVSDTNGFTYLQYYLSAYIVDKDFKNILYYDQNPLFTGSLNDQIIAWTDVGGNVVSFQPAVILPFGAFLEDKEVVMALGVNDAYIGTFRCPLENLTKRMTKVISV
jgi:predicted GH43/DUF377 family glycosyl hydrolase